MDVAGFLNNLRSLDPEINENNIASYTNSLCTNGFMFYYPEVEELKNCIFINPAWVTETIYAIMDEEVRKNGGEFGLKQVEAKAGKQHASAFIALMKKFELIFENPETNMFIAPQYLPAELSDVTYGKKEWNRLKSRFKDFETPDYYVRFTDFIPRSIMLRLLAIYGVHAIGQNYWKKGIAFMLERKEAVLLFEAASSSFMILVEDKDQYVQRLIFDTLLQLTENKDTLQIGLDKESFVQYSELKKYYQNNEVAAVSGKLISNLTLRHFTEDIEYLKKSNTNNVIPTTKQVKIFVSYAHEDEATKDLLLNTHLKAIQNHYNESLVVCTDAGIKPGVDWDNKIKMEIENADIILFLITISFLASEYIKNTEIRNALQRYKEKKQIIVPIYIESVAKKLLPFKNKQYLPDGTPLEEWEPRSKAWTKIQEGIITLIDDINAGNIEGYFD